MKNIEIKKELLTQENYNQLSLSVKKIRSEGCSEIKTQSMFYINCDHKKDIKKHFSKYEGFETYLDQVIQDEYNVVIHNILFLKKNQKGIRRHVNSTIFDILKKSTLGDIAEKYIAPDFQSIFYLDVPADLESGNLIIHEQDSSITVSAENNKCVFMSGGLEHEVTEIKTEGFRTTLFTEQYKIDPADWFVMKKLMIDQGSMFEIGLVDESSDDYQKGEYLMPYDK